MRTYTKTRLGMIAAAGAGSAALAVAGFALPASAADHDSSVDWTDISSSITAPLEAAQTWITDTIDLTNAPQTDVSPDTSVGDVSVIEGPLVNGPLLGDVLSGNQTPVGSGNDVQAPIGSGNDVQVPIEAPVEAPVGSGNDTAIDAPVGSGNESDNDTSIGGIGNIGAEVNDIVDDVTSGLGVDLGGLLD
jgi:hypothetical protein